MKADICDHDELHSGRRREGTFENEHFRPFPIGKRAHALHRIFEEVRQYENGLFDFSADERPVDVSQCTLSLEV